MADRSRSPARGVADTTAQLLAERQATHGDYQSCAIIAQRLKGIMRGYDRGDDLRPDAREALEMIATKMARILNGDPDHADSWDDIAGYARLVADRIRREADRDEGATR